MAALNKPDNSSSTSAAPSQLPSAFRLRSPPPLSASALRPRLRLPPESSVTAISEIS
ncbi:hypothetical protein WAI453_013560 [Rhynchosporium graminicola]